MPMRRISFFISSLLQMLYEAVCLNIPRYELTLLMTFQGFE